MISFPADTYPEVELLDHMVVPFLILGGNITLFSVVAAPVYIPTSRAQGLVLFSPRSYQHLLSLVFLMTAILTGVK